jgi:cellulose synthase operon protein C
MLKPGGEKEAQAALATALQSNKDSPKLLVMLGDAYRREGKFDEALAQYNKALADPQAKAPEARMAMGQIYRDVKKDYPKAAEAFSKAAQESVGQPSRVARANTELGRVYEAMSDKAKADEAYQRALNADVEFAPAYFFYARFLSQDRNAANKAKLTAQEYLKRDPRGEFAGLAQQIASQ